MAFDFGTFNIWDFAKAPIWQKLIGQYFTGHTKPPVNNSWDNNYQMWSDNAGGTSAIPTLKPADSNGVMNITNPQGFSALAGALSQLAAPAAPTVANIGTAGATTYAYVVVAKGGFGATLGVTPASAGGSTATGNAALSGSNFNQLTITAVTGAASYDVYRTVGGATQGKIGNIATSFGASGLAQNSVIGANNVLVKSTTGTLLFNDTGLAGDSTTAPTVNTTGVFTTSGPSTTGVAVSTAADTPYSNAGANTILAASLIWGFIRRTAGGAQTDTTDTAANIVAAIPNAQVGSYFEFQVLNGSGGVHTLGLGAGVTAAAGVTVTLTTASTNIHTFACRVTNVAAPAVTIYSLGQSAS